MAGELMLARARETGARLLPIDSEHCALHECLDGRRPQDVRRLLLTASGGPFRNRPARELRAHHARGGPRAPDLAHGAQDHDRLRDPDEQGPRGDRGALALRGRGREDRRARPPAVGRSTRWWSSWTGRCSRSSGSPTCACRSSTRSATREVGGGDPGHGLHEGDAARLRAARPREVPLPLARLPRARGRGHRARRPQRRERGGGGRLPRREGAVPRHPRVDPGSPRRPSRGRPPPPSRTCSRPTAGRGSAPGRSSRGGRPPAPRTRAVSDPRRTRPRTGEPADLMGFLTTPLAFVVVLGIIIFVHEFGHLITAKAFGMRVFVFSFGFGKRLARLQVGRHRLPRLRDPARGLREARGRARRPPQRGHRAPSATATTSSRARAGSASSSTSPGRP